MGLHRAVRSLSKPFFNASWPTSADELTRLQSELAALEPPLWAPPEHPVVAGCFVCFPRGESGPGRRGDPGWAAAAEPAVVVTGEAGAPYVPGLLALREGPLLAAAVRALPRRPDVLLVDATGRDHPRRAGLATHLGAVLDLPAVGVTHRPLLATGEWPANRRGATSPLRIDGEVVGCWLRVRAGVRPLAIHPAWRTDLDTAVGAVLATTSRVRAPEPLRRARTAARRARAVSRGP
jgi:deoxyribonuclease V